MRTEELEILLHQTRPPPTIPGLSLPVELCKVRVGANGHGLVSRGRKCTASKAAALVTNLQQPVAYRVNATVVSDPPLKDPRRSCRPQCLRYSGTNSLSRGQPRTYKGGQLGPR